MTTNSTDGERKVAPRYTIEEIRRDVADWLEFGPPPATEPESEPESESDPGHLALVEELAQARIAANPELPAARVVHQLTQADTNACLQDSWYSSAGELIDHVSDEDLDEFREEVRREIGRCPALNTLITGCLDRAFQRFSTRRHGDPKEMPDASPESEYDRWPAPALDEFDDEPALQEEISIAAA